MQIIIQHYLELIPPEWKDGQDSLRYEVRKESVGQIDRAVQYQSDKEDSSKLSGVVRAR